MHKSVVIGLMLSLACGAGSVAIAQTTDGLFSSHEPLVLELSAEWRNLCQNPDAEDCPDLPASITYERDRGNPHTIDIGLRLRGRWQDDTANCSLPSLFLVFDPATVSGTPFSGQRDLPLTTHCSSPSGYEQYLLREYLAHRIYNRLSEKSLSVRLARITYRDASGRNDPIVRYGFFSEHFESLAQRLDAEVWDPGERFDYMSADPFELATLTLFQYLIGNTDWSIVAGHNITYIRGRDWVTPVPFDLDYSGLVGASYAAPPEILRLTSVRQRVYRGFCRADTDWPALFRLFGESRAEIFGLLDETPGLRPSRMRTTRKYLEQFFEIMDSPSERERRIVNVCRNP